MDQLMEILTEVNADVDFETCDTLVDDGILDSFDIVELVSEISNTFDVRIPAEAIIPENFNSAETIYALIESLEDEDQKLCYLRHIALLVF